MAADAHRPASDQNSPEQHTSPSSEPHRPAGARAQFTIVAANRHAEAPRTLAEPVPQPLTLLDQFGLWGNLGVSLLGFTGALFVLQPLARHP